MLKQKCISCQNLVPYDFWHHPEIYCFFLWHGRKLVPSPGSPGPPRPLEPLEPGRQELYTLGPPGTSAPQDPW